MAVFWLHRTCFFAKFLQKKSVNVSDQVNPKEEERLLSEECSRGNEEPYLHLLFKSSEFYLTLFVDFRENLNFLVLFLRNCFNVVSETNVKY